MHCGLDSITDAFEGVTLTQIVITRRRLMRICLIAGRWFLYVSADAGVLEGADHGCEVWGVW